MFPIQKGLPLSIFALLLPLAMACGQPRVSPRPTAQHSQTHREAGDLARSPLQNEVRVTLDASLEDVWKFVSDHQSLPDYSVGIKHVSLHGSCEGPSGGAGCVRTCEFHEGPPLDEKIVLVDAPVAIATSAVEPNDYGLTKDLTLVTLTSLAEGRTEYRWRQYYEHPDVEAMKPIFDEALADIARRLEARFNGTARAERAQP